MPKRCSEYWLWWTDTFPLDSHPPCHLPILEIIFSSAMWPAPCAAALISIVPTKKSLIAITLGQQLRVRDCDQWFLDQAGTRDNCCINTDEMAKVQLYYYKRNEPWCDMEWPAYLHTQINKKMIEAQTYVNSRASFLWCVYYWNQ